MKFALLTLFCLGAVAPCAWAQEPPIVPSTRGFSVGGHVTAASSNPGRVAVSPEPTNPGRVTGPGGGFVIGYGLTDWFTVYLNGDGRESDGDLHLSCADLGAQFFFNGKHRLRPHLDAALTGRRSEFHAGSEIVDARGAGVSVGGGLVYFLSSSFALDATLLRTAGDLDRFLDGARLNNVATVGVSSTRFDIGIRWYPGR